MELCYFVYFVNGENRKLIGKYKKESEAFDCVTAHCEDPLKVKDLMFSRDISGVTVRYGITGEYYYVMKAW